MRKMSGGGQRPSLTGGEVRQGAKEGWKAGRRAITNNVSSARRFAPHSKVKYIDGDV